MAPSNSGSSAGMFSAANEKSKKKKKLFPFYTIVFQKHSQIQIVRGLGQKRQKVDSIGELEIESSV